MEILENKIIKTRKNHYCAYCGGKIEKGSKAVVWVYADGGIIQRNYGHQSCNNFIHEFDVYGNEEEITNGYLEDVLNDFYNDNISDLPNREIWNNMTTEHQCLTVMDYIRKQSKDK